jgi:hypothetical protein
MQVLWLAVGLRDAASISGDMTLHDQRSRLYEKRQKPDSIRVRGAWTCYLQSIDVDISRNRLVIVPGTSGHTVL